MSIKLTVKSIFFDIIIVSLSFVLACYLKGEDIELIFLKYNLLFILYAIVFVFFSLFFKKSNRNRNIKATTIIKRHFYSWSISSLIIFVLIFSFQLGFSSRFVVLGFILCVFGFEFLRLGLYLTYRYARGIVDDEELSHQTIINNEIILSDTKNFIEDEYSEENFHIVELVKMEFGEEIINFIRNHFPLYSSKTQYFDSNTRFSILKKTEKSAALVNFARLNDARKINKLIESVYIKLMNGAIYVCCAETIQTRKKRIFEKYPFGINHFIYFFDFLINRVSPKLFGAKKIYFFITKGQNRVLSYTEVLGRLYSCGFELVESKVIENLDWFIVKKTRTPAMDYKATYGPLIKLNRIGKNGKMIDVYKLRTMHPYSEYLQQYVHEKNSLADGGKFENDFRVSTLGRVCRRLWIDELPMFINFFKGELKLVGVRPLSKHYFSLYPKDMQEYRTKFKPGLIPPFYADLPKTFEEIVESERKYLLSYQKSPFITDFRYFWMAFVNIVFKNARSK